MRLKTALKGHCFQTIEEIQDNCIRELHAITESAFQEVGNGVLPVEGTTLKGTVLKMLQNEQSSLYSKSSVFF
jgi:hypothetical protein